MKKIFEWWYTWRLKKKYGDYIYLELGPGRIAEPRGHATLGLNRSADPFCDIYWNLERGIPLRSRSVDFIYSNQVLEHVARKIKLMNEFWRVLKSDGKMKHCVPDYRSEWAYADPTHLSVFTPKSFLYFSQREDGTPFVERFSDYGIECNFITRVHVRPGVDITVEMTKP